MGMEEQAKHITSINFDISGISESLNQVEKQLKEATDRIEKKANIKLDFGMTPITAQNSSEISKKVTKNLTESNKKQVNDTKTSQIKVRKEYKLTEKEIENYQKELLEILKISSQLSNFKAIRVIDDDGTKSIQTL